MVNSTVKKLNKRRPRGLLLKCINIFASPAVLRYPQFLSWDLNLHVHLRIPFPSAVQARLLQLIYQHERLLSNRKIVCIP